jgi:hypothetical protein
MQLMLKDVLLYPNSVSVPLMANFGVPPEPQGMVKVTLTKIENLKTTDLLTKGDPYVVFEVRLWLLPQRVVDRLQLRHTGIVRGSCILIR